jgi:hypothetical protein
MNMHEQPLRTMTAENADEFEVRIFESTDLAVSIVRIDAPWSVSAEKYPISQPTQ